MAVKGIKHPHTSDFGAQATLPSEQAEDGMVPPVITSMGAGSSSESDSRELGPVSGGHPIDPLGLGANIGPGTHIGQYEIIRKLGSGGMGVVYLAHDDKLGRHVAIKVLQIPHAELRRRFIVEARATARCTHENIVVIHEVGEYEGSPFMVLEYVEGQQLANLRIIAPLAVTRVIEIISGVARALAHAHDEGIVHRDLKPENILLGKYGTVKVLDFGIAKLLERNQSAVAAPISVRRPVGASFIQSHSQTGLVGTMPYMSPEQWRAAGDIDLRTDIWSVGLIMYELLSGKHPLMALGDTMAAWVQDLDVPIPSLQTVAPQLPEQLIQVVDNCLRKRREDRIQSARELLRALEPFSPGRYQAGRPAIETAPYAGLRAFQEEDAGRFFGRTAELTEVMTRIRDTPMLATIGPSGVGKSSFLRAGVIPAMKASGETLTVLTIRPGRHPMQVLTGLCAPLVDMQGLGTDGAWRTRLTIEPTFFGAVLREYCQRQRTLLFLLVDQFEELYTLGAPLLERQAFSACLTGAADDATTPIRVVLTIRADFLGRVAEDAALMNQLRRGLLFLGPPSKEGLRDALIRPAEAAGYRFENMDMISEMVQFLQDSPSGLPLLQFAASQLWEKRDPTRHLLTEQAYRSLGGVAGALVSHADRIVSRLSTSKQALCRSIFTHLVTQERTRAVRTLDELGELVGNLDEIRPLIEELVDSRLLVVQTHGDSATVELVHESLILSWPTLGRWLDASHEDSLFLDQLLAAAHQWDVNRRASGLLWSGEMVAELDRFQRRYKGQLSQLAQSFVAAIGKQALRNVRLRRALTVTGALLVAAIFAAGSVALVVTSRAKAQADDNAVAARAAAVEARKLLDERIAAERLAAQREEQRRLAEKKTVILEVKAKQADRTIDAQSVALKAALVRAQDEARRAEQAQRVAEQNEEKANEATARAEAAAEQERQRADRLTRQLGSQLVEVLKR